MSPPMAMSSFSSVPPEVLDMIVSNISNDTYESLNYVYGRPPPGARPDPADSLIPESTRTLISLSSTCRRLRTPTLIHIYSRICLTWTAWTDPPIILLLRTLVCRPDLAAIVKQVELTGWTVILRENAKNGIDALFSNEERGKLKLWMVSLGIGGNQGEEDDWDAAVFTKGDCDAITALFLSLLPNMQKLSLELDYSHRRVHPVYLYKLLKPTITTLFPNRPRLFPKLESIDMCTQRYKPHYYNTPELVSRFDTIPNIHLLPFLATPHMPFLSSMALNLANSLPLTPPPSSIGISQSLKSLTLTTMQADTLTGLLQICPRVETVRYMLLRQICLGEEYRCADMTRLREALEVRSDTLRSVTVVTKWYGKDGTLEDWEYYRSRRRVPEGPESVGFRGSLLPFGREMVRLERLSASLTVLVGMEMLARLEQIHTEATGMEQGLGFSVAGMLPSGLRELWIHRSDELGYFLNKTRYLDPCISLLVDQLLEEKACDQGAAKLETVSYPQVSWYEDGVYDEFGNEKYTLHELPLERVRKGKEVGVHIYHNEGVMDLNPGLVGHFMDSSIITPGQERGYRFETLLSGRPRVSRNRDGKVETGEWGL